MTVANGWRLYEHPAFTSQREKLQGAVEAVLCEGSQGWRSSGDAKLLAAIARLALEIIPGRSGCGPVPPGRHARQGAQALVSREVRQRPLSALLSVQLAGEGDHLRLGE